MELYKVYLKIASAGMEERATFKENFSLIKENISKCS
jgi:hypothetical protein